MDKVEKFKELYIKTLNQSRRFGIFGINDEDYEQYDKDKQELIKMYTEALNESIQQEEEA
jgi:hypothetical protein